MQPALVVRLGREPAELRTQPPRVLEEDAAVGRHGLVVAEQVLEHRCLGLLRLRGLRDLRQLIRIAQQDDVPRARAERDGVGQRDLTALVDDQRVERAVELLAREEPARTRDELVRGVTAVAPLRARLDEPALERVLLVRVLLDAAEREALLARLALHLARAGC